MLSTVMLTFTARLANNFKRAHLRFKYCESDILTADGMFLVLAPI